MKAAMISFLLALIALAAFASIPGSGVWTAEVRESRLHVTLLDGSESRSRWGGNVVSFALPVARFEGLTQAERTSFVLRAAAGTIEFNGYFSEGEGAGHFTFMPAESFRKEMAALGYEEVKNEMMLVFATHDFSPDVIRQLRSMGYEIPARQIDEVAIFGITPQVIRDYQSMGFAHPTLRELINLRIGNVDAAYIKAIRDLGFDRTDAKEIAETAILGVTPEYARQMKVAGFSNLSFRELRDLRIGNITPSTIAAFRAAGYPDLTARQLSEFGIQHVTPDYIAELRRLGYDKLSPRQLVEMRIFNVTPEYIHQMNALGIQDLGKMIELKTTGAADILLKKR